MKTEKWEKELGTLLMDIYIKQKKPSCQNYPLGQLSLRVGKFISHLLTQCREEERQRLRKKVEELKENESYVSMNAEIVCWQEGFLKAISLVLDLLK